MLLKRIKQNHDLKVLERKTPKISREEVEDLLYKTFKDDVYNDFYMKIKKYTFINPIDKYRIINLETGIDYLYVFDYDPELWRSDSRTTFDIGDIVEFDREYWKKDSHVDLSGEENEEFVIFQLPIIDGRDRDDWKKYAEDHPSTYFFESIMGGWVTWTDMYGITNGQLYGRELGGYDWPYDYEGYLWDKLCDFRGLKKKEKVINPINTIISETVKRDQKSGFEFYMYLYHEGIHYDLSGKTKEDVDKLYEIAKSM